MSEHLQAALMEKARRERARRQEGVDVTPMELLRQSPAGQTPGIAGSGQKINALDPIQGDPTIITPILDNIIGIDNDVTTPGEKISTALNNAGEALTLGVVGDEAAAAFDNAIGRGAYDERLKFYRDNQEQFREQNPVLSFASEIAPAIIPGLGGAKLISALTSKLGRAGAGAALGAISGLVYGFAEGEGGAENRIKEGAATAAIGGLFGATAPKIMDAVTGVPRRVARAFQKSQDKPNAFSLRAAKNAAYQAVDDAGETFSGDDMTGLFQRVQDAFDAGNYVEETDNALRATLRILERRSGQNTTLGQLDKIRQNLWKRYAAAKDQPQILDAIGEIDDLIASRSDANDLMSTARAANSRYAKFQLLDDAFKKAGDQTASAGSGGNIVNKYRQAVSSILNSEKKVKFFTADEVEVMRRFVRGTTTENLQRLVGKLSPSGNGLMMALHVIGGVASQGASTPLMVVGAGAKRMADRNAIRGAEAIKDVVSGQIPSSSVLSPAQITGGQGAAISGAVPVVQNALDDLRQRQGR